MWEGESTSHVGGGVPASDNGDFDPPAAWIGIGGIAVGSSIPVIGHGSVQADRKRLTGVTVVSSQPQSITRPVIRPQAFKASKAEGVNETEGTCRQLGCAQGLSAHLQVLEQRLGYVLFHPRGEVRVLQYDHLARFGIRHEVSARQLMAKEQLRADLEKVSRRCFVTRTPTSLAASFRSTWPIRSRSRSHRPSATCDELRAVSSIDQKTARGSGSPEKPTFQTRLPGLRVSSLWVNRLAASSLDDNTVLYAI